MLNASKERWTRHGREDMEATHQMEGSLHLIGQVVTPHQIKQREVCKTDIQMLYHTSVPR